MLMNIIIEVVVNKYLFGFVRIKDKINNPPEKRDFQKVSHSLARFIKLKDAAKTQQPQQKKHLKRTTAGNEDKPGKFF